MTKREFVEIYFKYCLAIMALVVVFGNQTFAEGTADDEALRCLNKRHLPMVNFGPGLFQTVG